MMTTEPCSETWCRGQFTYRLIIIKRYSNLRNWSNMIVWTLDWRHIFPLLSLLYMICIYYTSIWVLYMWYSLINHDPMHLLVHRIQRHFVTSRRGLPAPLSSQQLWPPLAAKGALDSSDGACPDLSWRFLLTFHTFSHLHTSPKLDKVGRFI